MTLKDQIILDLNDIQNPSMLNQILDFIHSIRDKAAERSNKKEVLEFEDKISDADAKEIKNIIDSEFNKIEGEW